MLSDEERKAMNSLKVISEYAGDNYLAKEHRRKLKLLIELVEKQQKEIEELKKPKYIIDCKTGKITTLTNDFVSKDKIKAKIEELENKLEYGWESEYEYCKEVLQSLLEKE